MYLVGQGQQQMGPGTGLVQRINWTGNPNPPLGLAGCGCGKCKEGLGLFDSGMDFSGWSYAEWAVVALGGYVFVSMVNDTRRVGRGAVRVAGAPGRQYRKVKKSMKEGRRKLGRKIGGTSSGKSSFNY